MKVGRRGHARRPGGELEFRLVDGVRRCDSGGRAEHRAMRFETERQDRAALGIIFLGGRDPRTGPLDRHHCWLEARAAGNAGEHFAQPRAAGLEVPDLLKPDPLAEAHLYQLKLAARRARSDEDDPTPGGIRRHEPRLEPFDGALATPEFGDVPTFWDRDASRLENIEPSASRLAGPGRCLLVFRDRGHRFGVLRVHPRFDQFGALVADLKDGIGSGCPRCCEEPGLEGSCGTDVCLLFASSQAPACAIMSISTEAPRGSAAT